MALELSAILFECLRESPSRARWPASSEIPLNECWVEHVESAASEGMESNAFSDSLCRQGFVKLLISGLLGGKQRDGLSLQRTLCLLLDEQVDLNQQAFHSDACDQDLEEIVVAILQMNLAKDQRLWVQGGEDCPHDLVVNSLMRALWVEAPESLSADFRKKISEIVSTRASVTEDELVFFLSLVDTEEKMTEMEGFISHDGLELLKKLPAIFDELGSQNDGALRSFAARVLGTASELIARVKPPVD